MDHTEVLLNFSSVGFIRDACATLNVIGSLQDGVDDHSEEMPSTVAESERAMRLSAAVGSSGWIEIVRSYSAGLSFWETERQISALLCSNARKHFKYVTNMPVKDMSQGFRSEGSLKYRLIHLTNNADGYALMNDNMMKRNKDRQIVQQHLFLVDIDGNTIDEDAISASMHNSIYSVPIGQKVSMWQLLAPVIAEHGVFDKSNALLKRYLKPYLDDGTIERVEKLAKTGQPNRDYGSGVKVYRAR